MFFCMKSLTWGCGPQEMGATSLSGSPCSPCPGKDGEHILHIESMLHTVIHVNMWGPEKRADIWIFGPPPLQRDTAQMLSNLAHFVRMQVMESKYGPGVGRAILPRKSRLLGRALPWESEF